MSIEVEVAQTLVEINEVLREVAKEKIDPSVYTENLQEFTDGKKQELQALIEQVDNPLGIKTKTFSTLSGGFRVIDAQAYQEVWMKDGRITKYGGLYVRGFKISGANVAGNSAASGEFVRQPLPNDVEFDMFWADVTCFYARPKAGQSDVGGVTGSLDNYLFAWGKSNYGALGTGATWDHYIPVSQDFQSRVKKVCVCSIGRQDACTSTFVLLENRELWVAGKNDSQCLGLGNGTQTNAWTRSQENVLDVYAIWRSTFFVKTDGVYAVGYFEQYAGGTASLTINTPTKVFSQIPRDIRFGKYYTGDTVHMLSMLWSSQDNKLYGAGRNGGNQITSSDRTDKQSFAKFSSNGEEFELQDGDTFETDGESCYILRQEEGNMVFYASGIGSSGFGDSQGIVSASPMRKIKTFDGTGWRLIKNQEGYIESNVWRSFFVINDKRREIFAFGLNDGSAAGGLGVGVESSKERAFRRVFLPENVKNAKQFEVYPFYCGAAGGIALIIDGDFYASGKVNSNCSLKFSCAIPQIQN